MIPILQDMLEKALKEARSYQPSREMSLAITKIEEALMWFKESTRPKSP